MKWVFLSTLIAASLVRLPSPVVRTTSGLVRGTLHESGIFYQYFGIPFGTVNSSNRFHAPLPPPKWEGVFEAIDENIYCPQWFIQNVIKIGHTDCLKLNIYVPVNAEKNNPLPVMVNIHGGFFSLGVSSRFHYGGDYVAEHGVIMVGINYRLSIEGFLCLRIKEAPGNAGLKDQLAALKWIKENIKAFGGDPDNVTLLGESAGASAVSLFLLSPLANGLFHKTIIQSGSSLALFSVIPNPITVASDFVQQFGYNTTDPEEIYKIVSTKTAYEMILPDDLSTSDVVSVKLIFRPCIEKELEGVESLITQNPFDILKSGKFKKVPMIVGYNNMEGLLIEGWNNKFLESKGIREGVLKLIGDHFDFPTVKERNVSLEKIENIYTSHREWSKSKLFDLYTDLYFKFPATIETTLKLRSSNQPMYLYLFKYGGLLNMAKMTTDYWDVPGATHFDEMFYLMKQYGLPLPHRFLETKMRERLLTLWTNFIKFGDPTPNTTELIPIKWRPSTEWNNGVLLIDERFSVGSAWDEDFARVWSDIYMKYRRNLDPEPIRVDGKY